VNLLLTGRPGIGKTTVVERVVASLPAGSASGFFTRELRERGVRHGFAIETLDGETAVLASTRFRGGPRVGRYRVDVAALDRIGVPTIARRAGIHLVVVDEIGKMECLSARFREAVRQALDASTSVLATVAESGGGFIAEVRRRPDVTLLVLSPAERDTLPARLVGMLGIRSRPG
jgi:nucleoside-triphosphatase